MSDNIEIEVFDTDTYLVTDNNSGITIKFQKGKFNDTQDVVSFGSVNNPTELAKIMRKIGEWLAKNHPDKL